MKCETLRDGGTLNSRTENPETPPIKNPTNTPNKNEKLSISRSYTLQLKYTHKHHTHITYLSHVSRPSASTPLHTLAADTTINICWLALCASRAKLGSNEYRAHMMTNIGLNYVFFCQNQTISDPHILILRIINNICKRLTTHSEREVSLHHHIMMRPSYKVNEIRDNVREIKH